MDSEALQFILRLFKNKDDVIKRHHVEGQVFHLPVDVGGSDGKYKCQLPS